MRRLPTFQFNRVSVLAPREMQPRPLCGKIEEDYRGALAHHATTPIKRWILVHNDWEELPTEAHELVIRLRAEEDGVPIEIWGPEPLISRVMELSAAKLALLFPNSLSSADLRKIQYRDIDELIESIGELTGDATYDNIDAPTSMKIAHNAFSDSVSIILRGGFLVQRRFANYFADTSRAVVGNRLADKFKALYREKKRAGLDADQIFWALCEAVGGLACEKPRRAAIVGLVTYMFHSCDIFEDVPTKAVS